MLAPDAQHQLSYFKKIRKQISAFQQCKKSLPTMQVCFIGATTRWCCSAQSLKPSVSIAQSFTRCFLPIGSRILYPWLSFSVFTVCCVHHSAATKLTLAPISIKTFY